MPIIICLTSRLKRVLQRVLHEAEFLSPYGIRGISKEYTQPYELTINGENCLYNINQQNHTMEHLVETLIGVDLSGFL